ncbi:MAG: ABC-F family ATP-binding cassette domain-containing protein, partial [bacterium]|nr:ABC-F family ATP-binding cassette domain-containing protein [bacterium]
IAGAVMFQGDDALKKISVLSGGEKSRVLLGKLLATPSNLLLLDEPTNHLDMESCDALMAAIDEFNGAVIIVTHNEMFLNTLATRFVVFQSDGVHIHEGSYQSFLEKIGWEDEEPVNQGRTGEEGLAEKKEPINKKDLRKLRADITTRRSKAIKPLETKISKIEASIEENEAILAKLNTAIIEASSAGEGEKIAQLSKELHTCQKEIDSLYEEFERYTIEYDEKALVFDEELKQLEE